MNADDRYHAIRQARSWLECQPVYLDTETTGLGQNDQICQVAVIDHAGQVLLNALVKPTIPIPPEAVAVHGITDLAVQDAPPYPVILPQLAACLDGRHVVIYNAEYDLRLLAQSARVHGLADGLHPARVYDAMLLYSAFYGDWNEYRRSYRWHKLAVAGYQCGIELPPDLHAARADAELTRRVLLHMAAAKE